MWQFLQRNNKSPFRVIILGFLLVILMGSLLLMLPVSTRDGISTPFGEALFTATSAVCVTGLVIHDTATYHVNIMAIKQNGKFSMTVITPDTCLPENSTILVLGTQRDIQKCFHI